MPSTRTVRSNSSTMKATAPMGTPLRLELKPRVGRDLSQPCRDTSFGESDKAPA